MKKYINLVHGDLFETYGNPAPCTSYGYSAISADEAKVYVEKFENETVLVSTDGPGKQIGVKKEMIEGHYRNTGFRVAFDWVEPHEVEVPVFEWPKTPHPTDRARFAGKLKQFLSL